MTPYVAIERDIAALRIRLHRRMIWRKRLLSLRRFVSLNHRRARNSRSGFMAASCFFARSLSPLTSHKN